MTPQPKRLAAAVQQAARASEYEDADDAAVVIVAFLRAVARGRETICSVDDLADEVEALGDE